MSNVNTLKETTYSVNDGSYFDGISESVERGIIEHQIIWPRMSPGCLPTG